jgi:hypothetical protein
MKIEKVGWLAVSLFVVGAIALVCSSAGRRLQGRFQVKYWTRRERRLQTR